MSDRDTSGVAAAYAAALAAEVPRVLGLLDRDLASRTRGCFDRQYWSWKFTDFPAPRMQEGLYFLAFLYTHPLPGVNLVGDARLREWMEAAFHFWARLQHGDGSFDEAYPFERSLAATAFTTFYIAEALALVENELSESTAANIRAALRRASDWLCRHEETHGFLSNHLAAAAAALDAVHRFVPEVALATRRQYFIERILARQSDEGWYEEYGGADPGYQTHGSFYLSRILERTADAALRKSLARACRFQAHCVHPDRSLGGSYASRNTQTYYPAAFEMLSRWDGSACWIAHTMAPDGPAAGAVGLAGIDMGNYFPMLNNYAFAYQACRAADHRAAAPEPPAGGTVHFPKAGISRVEAGEIVAYIGTGKGGVVQAYDRGGGRLIGSDCGYIGRLRGGPAISSQTQGGSQTTHASSTEVSVAATFHHVDRPIMTPGKFLLFRLFMLTAGRWGRLACWIKRLLVQALIGGKQSVALQLNRTVRVTRDGVTITDELSGPHADQVADLRWGDAFSTIHMGSSRYFVPHEAGIEWPSTEALDISRLKEGLSVTRVFSAAS